MSYTAGDVMDLACALLNDTGKALYTYTVQLPYLKSAVEQLEQHLIIHEASVLKIDESVIAVAEGDTELTLPTSFFVPIAIEERGSSSESFQPVREVEMVNRYAPSQVSGLYTWDYRHNCINFVGATQDRQVRLMYWRHLPIVTGQASEQYVDGAKNALAFRTAALCARYIGNNKERSDELNIEAIEARDLLLTIFVKNQQGLTVRRRPFRGRR